MTLASLAAGLLASGPSAWAAKPEPPLEVRLRVVAADEARGLYRIEARVRSRVSLENAVLVVQVRGGASTQRDEQQPLVLRRGQELRRETAVEALPYEPVTVLVGLGGTTGNARLHRTESLELGPPRAPGPEGRVRTDAEGREYFEVPMRREGNRP